MLVAGDGSVAKDLGDYANRLNLPIAVVDKRRVDDSENPEAVALIGDVEGKNGLIIDDEIASGGTMIEAARFIGTHGAARVEAGRTEANERMAALFDQVDVVICASNPDVAFPAEIESNTRVAGEKSPAGNNGALTIPANVSGNPAVSVPAGLVDGLPVGVQFIGRQHTDRMVLDLAAAWERLAPWPLVAP